MQTCTTLPNDRTEEHSSEEQYTAEPQGNPYSRYQSLNWSSVECIIMHACPHPNMYEGCSWMHIMTNEQHTMFLLSAGLKKSVVYGFDKIQKMTRSLYRPK